MKRVTRNIDPGSARDLLERVPRACICFASDHRVLRIRGRASVRTDPQALHSYNLPVARKYLLTPGGIRNALLHIRQIPLTRNYHAQGAEKGQPCIIEVTPEQAEFLSDEKLG